MSKARNLLLAVALIIAGHESYSQAEVGIGLKVGANLASFNTTGNITSNYSNVSGYHIGAYALFKFTKIGIQPEILYSKQGSETTYNSQKLTSTHDYITVPVMFKFYLISGLNIQAGLQAGFLASSSGDVYNTAANVVTTNTDYSSFMKATDYAVPVGIGLDLPFGLNITARYNIGLTDVNSKTGPSTPALVTTMGNSAAKSQVLQFSIGYRFFKLGH